MKRCISAWEWCVLNTTAKHSAALVRATLLIVWNKMALCVCLWNTTTTSVCRKIAANRSLWLARAQVSHRSVPLYSNVQQTKPKGKTGSSLVTNTLRWISSIKPNSNSLPKMVSYTNTALHGRVTKPRKSTCRTKSVRMPLKYGSG